MKKSILISLIALAGLSSPGAIAQERLKNAKIFDVHLHGNPSVEHQLNDLKDHGVYKAAVSTSWPLQQRYSDADSLEILHGLMVPCPDGRVPYSLQPCFDDGTEWPPLDWVEGLMKGGKLDFLGEVLTQYYGISSSDTSMHPYYALAEMYAVPVGIHTGSAGPDHGSRNFKEEMGNPLLLKEILDRFPKLRVWIMHAGLPFYEETIEILKAYPHVYLDVSAINNPHIIKPEVFSQVMKSLVDAGFEGRIMFGSDNGDIEVMIRAITSLPFLSEDQKENILFRNAERFFATR